MHPARSGYHLFRLLATVLLLSPPASSQTRLRVLFTHDLHSTFAPRTVLAPDGRHLQSGGYARLASALQQQSALNPDGTLIVDGGDFTMGTLFHTLYLTESPELLLMGTMGYDVVTLGNHDFDFHLDGLATYLNNAREKSQRLPAVVMSNLTLATQNTPTNALRQAFRNFGVQRFVVLERNGIRIGVFGVMGKDAADDSPFIDGASFEDISASAIHTVQVLRDSAKVDVVLCLSHSGTSETQKSEEDLRLARSVPGIDVIISGHTHRILHDPIVAGNTAICSAGAFGSYLGILDLLITPPGRPRLEHYRLMPIDASLPEDSIIAGAIEDCSTMVEQQFLAPLGLRSDQVVAEAGFDFESVDYAYAHPGETGLGDMIADAYFFAVTRAEGSSAKPIDAAIVPLGMIRGSCLRGPITVADAFQVLSLGLGPDGQPGYPLITLYITGADLLKTLEIETTISALKEDAHLQVAGIQFRYNPCRMPLNRVTGAALVDSAGHLSPIVDDRLYRVCVCLYSAIMLTNVSSLSHGLITITLRRSNGTIITDLNEMIVDLDPARPGTQELKEWTALTRYLRSFPPAHPGGHPRVPDRYRTPAGRFAAEASLNPIDLVRNPNRFTIAALVTGMLALTGVLWLIVKLTRRARRH